MAALSSKRVSIHGGLSALPGRVLSRRSGSWPARKPTSYACCIAAVMASLRTRRVQIIRSLGVAQTLLTAVATMFAPFQQTAPHPRPTGQSPPPSLLIFGMGCRILRRAHGW